MGNFAFFDHYPKDIGAVEAADFARVLAPCQGHEIITVVGPKEYAEPQLTERGIAYQVIDWEARYLSQLSEKEKKAWAKEKATKEAKK